MLNDLIIFCIFAATISALQALGGLGLLVIGYPLSKIWSFFQKRRRESKKTFNVHFHSRTILRSCVTVDDVIRANQKMMDKNRLSVREYRALYRL